MSGSVSRFRESLVRLESPGRPTDPGPRVPVPTTPFPGGGREVPRG